MKGKWTRGRRAWFFALILCLMAGFGLGCGPSKPDSSRVSGEPDPSATAGPPPSPPLLPAEPGLNLLVISFDALRPDVLGAYGGTRGASPHIDRFAERSLVFEHAYSVAPVTPTSFAAVFSGFLPTRVFHAWRFRAPETLADRLSHSGYHTAAFLNNVQLTPKRGFDVGFDEFFWSRNDPDEEVLQRVEDWLTAAPPKPLFLWVHFLAPHAPYRARPEAAHLYRDIEPGRFVKSTGGLFEAKDAGEQGRIYDLYLGEVWRADRNFGRLIDHLRKLDLWGSSIVVLTSDHGEEFGEHGGFQHGRVYEEHLRVPLILHHPRLTAGERITTRVRNVDLLPTLLQAVGHPVHEPLDGRVIPQASASSSTLSSATAPPLVALSMTGEDERWVSITEETMKLIVTCRDRRRSYELYDLGTDPGERLDLAREHPPTVRRLLRALQTLLGGPPCKVIDQAIQGRKVTVGLDAEDVEALRALGYVH